MSFLTLDNLRRVTMGRWLQRPLTDDALWGVSIDTREDLTNKIFLALKGERHDSHDFLELATQSGARVLLVERDLEAHELPESVGVMKVDDSRKALARLAKAYRQSLTLTKVIGITGTVGKTTTKRLIDAVLGS
ncbi:MAG: Mur ligase domain-containing protein, partial [Planctomycetota bacterium]|nr:Mur ligase domain-containing protein [Planctomycetota bacterium]